MDVSHTPNVLSSNVNTLRALSESQRLHFCRKSFSLTDGSVTPHHSHQTPERLRVRVTHSVHLHFSNNVPMSTDLCGDVVIRDSVNLRCAAAPVVRVCAVWCDMHAPCSHTTHGSARTHSSRAVFASSLQLQENRTTDATFGECDALVFVRGKDNSDEVTYAKSKSIQVGFVLLKSKRVSLSDWWFRCSDANFSYGCLAMRFQTL